MLISIVVPAYNVGRYIGECIESILKQTYSQWELILVNDGSTDDTLDIATQFTQSDSRIQLISQENAGVCAARNTGLFAANGQFIAFLDGDDMWKPEFLKEAVASIQHSNANMIYCGYDRLYENGYIRKYRYHYPSGEILIPPPQEPVRLHICAILFERELLLKHNITFMKGCLIGEDWEMIAKALTVSTVQSVKRNLMIYRQRKGSALHTRWDWQKRIHALEAYQRAIAFMKENLADNPAREAILTHHRRQLGYQTLRFFWRMIKAGAHQDALRLMADEKFRTDFAYVQADKLGFLDSLKYKILESKNISYWRALNLLITK